MGITPTESSWVWITLGLLSIPLLIAVNAFFVFAEFALVLVRKTRVKEMLQQGRIGASTVEEAVKHIDHTIAAVQVGITAAGIALGCVGEPALARLVEPAVTFLPTTWQGVVTHSLAFGVTLLFLTFLCIIFGELIRNRPANRRLRASRVARVGWLLSFFGGRAGHVVRALGKGLGVGAALAWVGGGAAAGGGVDSGVLSGAERQRGVVSLLAA